MAIFHLVFILFSSYEDLGIFYFIDACLKCSELHLDHHEVRLFLAQKFQTIFWFHFSNIWFLREIKIQKMDQNPKSGPKWPKSKNQWKLHFSGTDLAMFSGSHPSIPFPYNHPGYQDSLSHPEHVNYESNGIQGWKRAKKSWKNSFLKEPRLLILFFSFLGLCTRFFTWFKITCFTIVNSVLNPIISHFTFEVNR